MENIGTESVAYAAMFGSGKIGDLILDLMGSTPAMRDAMTKWLPMEEKEHLTQYRHRLTRSVLFGAFADTVRRITAKPFSRDVTINGELPPELEPILENADFSGRNLTQFSKDIFLDALKWGMTHILVDFPSVGSMRADQERQAGAYPYFVHVSPPDLINWRWEKSPEGRKVLTEASWRELRTDPLATGGDEEVTYIRKWTLDGWELWKQTGATATGTYQLVEEGTHTFTELDSSGRARMTDGVPRKAIPWVTVYFTRTGFMQSMPPLEDLAWLNLRHWQESSDYQNIKHVVAVPTRFVTGVKEEEKQQFNTISAGRTYASTNPDARMNFVEHSGAGVEALRVALQDLEGQMELLGLQPLIRRRSGTDTATGKAIDEANADTDAQAWIRSCENGLEECFRLAGHWIRKQLPEDFSVDIFNEFGLGLRAEADAEHLLKASQGRRLSKETYLREIKRRGYLADTVEIEEEMQRIEDEAPDLAFAGARFNGMQGEEEEKGKEGVTPSRGMDLSRLN